MWYCQKNIKFKKNAYCIIYKQVLKSETKCIPIILKGTSEDVNSSDIFQIWGTLWITDWNKIQCIFWMSISHWKIHTATLLEATLEAVPEVDGLDSKFRDANFLGVGQSPEAGRFLCCRKSGNKKKEKLIKY